MSENFEMFEEYPESQSFYDTKTKNIYVVSDEYGQRGNTIIQEITPKSFEYQSNISRYNEWKIKQCFADFTAHIDIPIIAKSLEEAKKKVEELFKNEENNKFTYVIDETK